LACSTAFGRLRWCAAVLTRGGEPPGPPRLVVAVGPDPAVCGGRRPGPSDGPYPAIGAGVGVARVAVQPPLAVSHACPRHGPPAPAIGGGRGHNARTR
jgi:hypothetical protein